MTNIQTILVGSIAFFFAAWMTCGRRITWTDRVGWIATATITWAFFVGWLWHVGRIPSAPILALASMAVGGIGGGMLKRACTTSQILLARARPAMLHQSHRSWNRRPTGAPIVTRLGDRPSTRRAVHRSRRVRTTFVALLASLVGARAGAQTLPAGTAAQSDTAEEKSLLDRLSFVLDFDVVSAYYFRGIPQENQGFIGQPYATINFTAYESESWLNNVTLSLTSWNSVQTGPTGSGGDHSSPDAWYESDIVASLTATMFDKWSASIIYTAYTSPNDSYNTVQEVAFRLSFDDTQALGAFALHPYALLAFEIDDQADGGNTAFNPIAPTSEGIYLELGIAPSAPLIKSDKWPISLTMPITVGIGLDNYYENGAGGNRGAQFGFVDVGFDFGLPISAIMPSGSSEWSLKAGPHLIWLGDGPASLGQGITGGDHFDVWWKLSLSVTF